MTEFTQDNTRGYTDSELSRLNDEWERVANTLRPLDPDPDQWQHARERLLTEFDQLRPEPERYNFCANGDVLDTVTGELVGRIDSDADWRPASEVPTKEIRRALRVQIRDNPEFFARAIDLRRFAERGES
jgi:hypothetical protein